MQKICIDLKEFKTIRQDGGVYVDKTKHIYDIFGQGIYFFLARPRRFGKSLLCSTLAELFSGNRELFKGLWIDQSSWEWIKYPVIRLDMSSAAGKTSTVSDVRTKIVNLLQSNATALGVGHVDLAAPSTMFNQLIEKAKALYGQNVVAVIDEYDKPLLDVIDDVERRKEIHKELSDLYSQLKPAEENLRCVLITGVFKFTQTSIFSGLNNLNDITFDPNAAALVGYTEDEMRHFFAEHLAALAAKNRLSVDEMMAQLQAKYNGYNFGVDIDTKTLFGGVYNSFAINYVFAKQQLLDKWFASGTPTALIKKLAAERLQALTPSQLLVNFRLLEQSCSPDDLSTGLLLYYAGYLTMKACTGSSLRTMLTLDFPNASVAMAFSEALLPEVMNLQNTTVSRLVFELQNVLCDQQLDQLQELLNDALANVSYTLLPKGDERPARENMYQIIFTILFTACGVRVTTEEHTNRGRIDMVLEVEDMVYVVELKMDQPAAVAMAQIKEKEYSAKFKHTGKQLYAVGIAVNTETRSVAEVVWEQLLQG
ncbi:hypothetical protein FJ365_03205 [Candidatus Dependentiae bacterium]|nr:hypothetical protein [Candidatus Dependentiae bacterium]